MCQDNIIVSNHLQAQITDFGVSQILDVKGFTTCSEINVRFTAPELIPMDQEPYTSPVRLTRQSDIFSLGILLLQVCSDIYGPLLNNIISCLKLFHGPDSNRQRGLPYNHVPFTPSHDVGLARRIREGERPHYEDKYNYMDDQHWAVICACWTDNPGKRPTIMEVKEAL